MQTEYLIVIEKTPNSLSAFSPDLPGCVVTGSTQAEVEDRMREAIRMHLDGMREDGLAIPVPTSVAEYSELFLLDQSRRIDRLAEKIVAQPTCLAGESDQNQTTKAFPPTQGQYLSCLATRAGLGTIPHS